MSWFGDDAGADDAYDASGARLDPAAVAIRLWELRGRRWFELSELEQAAELAVVAALLAALRREGSIR